jgi:hypothetical protein
MGNAALHSRTDAACGVNEKTAGQEIGHAITFIYERLKPLG